VAGFYDPVIMSWTQKSRPAQKTFYDGKRKSEHWYRDKQVYFLTARCKDRSPAFKSEDAQLIFWDRFEHYTGEFRYQSWVTSLMVNHYHNLGYAERGSELGEMMRKIHGSIAKLVNDVLEVCLVPFWIDHGRQSYFDGCIRDELQGRRSYRYTLTQCVRHGICDDYRKYPGTRVYVGLEDAMGHALKMNGFLHGVPYKRYMRD
jgi:hypothetical protein